MAGRRFMMQGKDWMNNSLSKGDDFERIPEVVSKMLGEV